MNKITSLIALDPEFSASLDACRAEYGKDEPLPVVINGLSGGASYAYLAEAVPLLARELGVPVLILTGNDTERDKIADICRGSGMRAAVYKRRELVFHNISASHDVERERLSVLISLLSGELDAVVTTTDAAASVTVPEGLLSSLVTVLKPGVEISPELLCERLSVLGYVSCDTVESAGQFARRGGIVDFYLDAASDPVRVEFFGDEIDRMVRFDPLTQRSVGAAEEIRLLPAIEVMPDGEAKERLSALLLRLAEDAKSENTRNTLKRDLAALEAGLSLESRDKYLGIIYPHAESLIDYFATLGRGVVINFGTADCDECLRSHLKLLADSTASLIDSGLITAECAAYSVGEARYREYLSASLNLHINTFAGASSLGKLGGLFGFRTKRTVAYGGNPKMLMEDVKGLVSIGYRVVLECENTQSEQALAELLSDNGYLPVSFTSREKITLSDRGCVCTVVGDVEGFDLITPRVALLSMARDEGKRIMSHRRRRRILKEAGGPGKRIMSYADLEIGDYVVHANYGIGLFEGIQSVRVDGATKDYITIKYAGTDKLYVPCDRLEMIGKYIGAREQDGSVKLSKMGGNDWNRAKSRTKKAVRDIAEHLIKLYAERQRTQGFAFPRDSELEDEFALGFEYTETDSQTAAIEEIKADMMKPVPMNRLLCGDVGFGKTEVALRAAFKAVMGGKQVAILVPTTLLALQHYQTALARMRGYPVNIEMLSRFRKPKEQAAIIERVRCGRVDILIGTHKLLGKQISFKDLGLLIVDEEQRFGVMQKEKLKEMSTNIDVLTLSATPIPRTLNMAINGISDMSVLEEPPENRRPVQTYVLEHDDAVIADAIRREMSRSGQVLYLFNNIETIDYVADKLMKAIPEARVAVAHGRMEKEELEDIWQSLIEGELDVLVCTTIIETGVDLPGANTLIIENADRFGLSQLHQIRGRVGRSERQAYAYFTYRPGKALSEIARKRLSAIREYAEFGAGFKVALCDLEIRGAGNLLGAEQHGYIDSVGYDLYVKLLGEAVLEIRGVKSDSSFESTIDFKVDAHIPEYYISKSAQRMEIYKKISHIATPEDMGDLTDELIDRFGDPPMATLRLLRVALCRAIAEAARIPRIELRGSSILFHMPDPDLSIWSMVLARHQGRLIGAGKPAPIIYKLRGGEDALSALLSVMTDYYNEMKAEG
ncbi:MAG: transcription-repair coupling factor [Ruminococcaceae bacterium]|nr:transcription-repair coupling factor [Oscillospiraceae bacterium]